MCMTCGSGRAREESSTNSTWYLVHQCHIKRMHLIMIRSSFSALAHPVLSALLQDRTVDASHVRFALCASCCLPAGLCRA
ncbi:hypothetical protein D0O09_11330 [Pseudomonas putida]|nr:hypothetical protein D0O09_11330 [Pseudomonas putida]